MPAADPLTASEPPLGVADATARILDDAAPLEGERVRLVDAHGRVLSEPVHAPRDLPPWRNASMDGYAVRAADIDGASEAAPVRLRVVAQVAAGTLPVRPIDAGEAGRIMTGAPLPDGADSVVRIEDTDRGDDLVAIRHDRDAGMNVRPLGEDLAAGAIAGARGQLVDAATLGVLAAAGAREVSVHRRPRVAILSAGDELVPLESHDRAVAEQRIVDINALTLAAMARDCGADVHALGLAPDDPAVIESLIAAAPPFDVLVTSGGVSVGAHDHTRDVLRSLGASILVHRLRIRPGAPLAFGRLGARRWVGLPGNPVSAMVTFELFVRPLLRQLGGHTRLFRATVPARVREPVHTAAPLTHFLRAVLTPTPDGVYEAVLTGPQGSGLITSMARANALLIVPESRREVAAGTVLRAMLLGDTALHSDDQVA